MDHRTSQIHGAGDLKGLESAVARAAGLFAMGLLALLCGALSLQGCAGQQHKGSVSTPPTAQEPQAGQSGQDQAAEQQQAASEQSVDPAASGQPGDAPAPVRRGPPPTGLVQQATQSLKRGQYETAIRTCKDALRRDEKYVPAMEVMARAYFELGKTEFSESICDIALGIDQRSGRCHTLKGFAALRSADAPRALQAFKKSTEVQPDYGPGWLNLGAGYLKVKNYDGAVDALEHAARSMGARPEVYLNLGAAYRGAGRLAEADKALRRALELRPYYASAYFNLGVLYLDAPAMEGMNKVQQLQRGIGYLLKYRQRQPNRGKADPVETYLAGAQRQVEREKRRIVRQKRRKAREAAKRQEEKAAAAEREQQEAAAGSGAASEPAADDKTEAQQ